MEENKFDAERHQHNLKEYDDKIAGLEAEILRQQEGRREYLNRHNLNKTNPD
jgi:hypothetical protein